MRTRRDFLQTASAAAPAADALRRLLGYEVCAVLVVVSGALLAGGSVLAKTGTGAPASSVTSSSLLWNYKKWTRVNPIPYQVESRVSELCAAAAPAYPESPHHGRYITAYVNWAGRRAMMDDLRPHFPVGSVIVKEKRRMMGDTTPELLTVMEKKPAGFDPKHGDWQYSVFDGKAAPISAAGVAHCQKCHESVKGADYVFRGYLPKELRAALR